MQDQMYNYLHRDTGDFLPPFLATVSWHRRSRSQNLFFFLSEYRSHEDLYAFADVKICPGSGSGWLLDTGYWTMRQGTFLAEDFLGTMLWWLQNPPWL